MNKKLLIPILLFVICWNTVLISFNDTEHDDQDFAVLEASESVSESYEVDEVLTVYNHVDEEKMYMSWEDYMICVLSAEMPVSYGLEALKAQAVAARTYTVYCINKEKEKINNADVCTDYKHCQAFKSMEDVKNTFTPEEYSIILRAVSETRGEILEYDGGVINAVYHASSADKTESAENVWGAYVPYLISVPSEGEDSMKGFESEVVITKEGFLEKLAMYGYPITEPGNCRISAHYNENNRVSYLELIGEKNVTIPGTEIRSIFALKSCCFTMMEENGNIKFSVKGYGHGVGMSQYGAKIMAENGKSYKDILSHYYNGCKIEKRNF